VNRVNQRQGFLVSAIVHVTMLMILISGEHKPRKIEEIDPALLERKSLVFLPRPESLRQALPPALQPTPPTVATPPPAVRTPVPPTPPPPPSGKDRISVGPPSSLRSKDPEIDLNRLEMRKGEMNAAPPTPIPAPQAARPPLVADGGDDTPGRPGLRLPPGLDGQAPRGTEGSPGKRGPLGASIDGAVDQLERKIAEGAQFGSPTGKGLEIGGLHFDPQGADFTLWLSRLKNELDRNWIPPPSLLMGMGGRVEIEFTVERDGSVSQSRVLRSSGMPAVARSVLNALLGSRLLPLPSDFGPPRLTAVLIVTFFEGPKPS
jgi:TonB family protein